MFGLQNRIMKFEEIIKAISEDFTKAWNEWDIEKLMSFLSNNVVIYSPKILLVYPDNTACKLQGKENLRDYWTKLKVMTDNTRVDQISITKVDREIKTVNKVVGKEIIINETIILNEYGKIEYLKYQYE